MKSQSEIQLTVALNRVTMAESFNSVLTHINLNRRELIDNFTRPVVEMIELFCIKERNELVEICGEELERFKKFRDTEREAKKALTNNIVITFR